MKIILLSGGSGNRLWPLSNSVRSKQFLKLLDGNGDTESMAQRIFRQLKNNGLSKDTIISTNISQKDYFFNQIGEDITIVAEPSRRNTFAAIALASSYLKTIVNCENDEPIVVIPCDQYVDDQYFNSVKQIAERVKIGSCDIVLMGIKPTMPTSKFGYILTERQHGNNAMKVKEFKEKPPVELAQKYIESGAFWNGGVFGFKLGFILDFITKYLPSSNYHDVVLNFNKLPLISFDYEVVENCENIEAIPYSGNWEDLGSWSTFAKRINNNSLGNVIKSGTCKDSIIINESNVPIVCSGISNLAVIASYDGILVANKDESNDIRSLLENLSERPFFEERRWGIYKVLDSKTFNGGISELTKYLFLYPGKSISYQTHQYRDEIWTIIDGHGIFVLDEVVRSVTTGDVLVIKAGQKHTIKAISNLSIIEVQLGSNLVESDIERFDWDWNDTVINE